jgi:ankyrin repeat protein
MHVARIFNYSNIRKRSYDAGIRSTGMSNKPVCMGITLIVFGILGTVGGSLASGEAAGRLTLISAAKRGDLTTIQELLQRGVNPDAHDAANNTPLIFAARDGHIEIVRVLVEGGATVNWVDDEGVTPLILASFKGHTEVAKFLLDHGADPSVQDQWGRTALDYALRRGEEDEISKLLRR